MKQSKAEFVRTFPRNVTAAEVVAAGKKRGIRLSKGYVYGVRSAAKRGQQKQASPEAGKLEALLLAAGAELGLSRAIGILQEQRKLLVGSTYGKI